MAALWSGGIHVAIGALRFLQDLWLSIIWPFVSFRCIVEN